MIWRSLLPTDFCTFYWLLNCISYVNLISNNCGLCLIYDDCLHRIDCDICDLLDRYGKLMRLPEARVSICCTTYEVNEGSVLQRSNVIRTAQNMCRS